MATQSLERKIDLNVEQGKGKGVDAMLDLYERARDTRRSTPFNIESTWKRLKDFYLDSFKIRSEKEFVVNSKLLFQAQEQIAKSIKRPSRRFVSDALNNFQSDLVQDGINTVQDKGGLNEVFTEKWGTFRNFTGYGDAFIRLSFGKVEKSDKQPILYTKASLTSVYVDSFATQMRTATGHEAAGEMLIVEEMSYDKAKALFPNVKFSNGKLPLSRSMFEELTKTDTQQAKNLERSVEIGYYYNIQSKKPYYGVFLGSGATPAEEAEGDSYPWVNQEEPFIPLVHFKCFPLPEGFYSAGIWQLLYDYALVQKKLRNMALAHVEDNVNPINFLSTTGKASAIQNQILQAREARDMGEKAYVINQLDSLGGSSNMASLQIMNTPPLTQEYERILADLTQEIKRMGINLDAFDAPASQAATTSLIEKANETDFVEERIELNLGAFRELDEMTMAMMVTSFNTDNSKIGEMGVITHAKTEGEKVEMEDIIDSIENDEIQVDVQSRTGSYKSAGFRMAANQEALNLTAGTPLQGKLVKDALRLRGIDATDDEVEEAGKAQQEQGVSPSLEPQDAGVGQAAQAQRLISANQPT